MNTCDRTNGGLARLVSLIALCVSTGCSALDRMNESLYETGVFDVEPTRARAVARDCGVAVVTAKGHGRGTISGRRTVLTVAHLVGDALRVEVATSSLAWTPAAVVRRIASSPEDLVELELEADFAGFEPERHANLARGTPAFVLTATGIHGWERGGLRHGDSGSPVINVDGDVIGLLVGLEGGGVYSPVAALVGVARPVVTRLEDQQ